MGSAVPKLFRHGAKTLAYRADFLARVNGVLRSRLQLYTSCLKKVLAQYILLASARESHAEEK